MGGIKFPGCYIADPMKLIEIDEKDFVIKTPFNTSLFAFGRLVDRAPLNDSYEDLLMDFDIFNPFIIWPLPVYKFK